MIPVVSRPLTSVSCLLGALCASIAWTGHVALRTWADPATPGRVVAAVLADDDARVEVLAPVERWVIDEIEAVDADDLASTLVPADAPSKSSVASALRVALADTEVQDRITRIVTTGSGEASPSAALGALIDAVSPIDPDVAAELAGIESDLDSTVEPDAALDLPTPSFSDRWRDVAQRWTWRLAAAAAVLFSLSFVVGDRRRTLRNVGWWAAATGATWWIGPLLVGVAARRWMTSVDAIATVVVDSWVAPIRAPSIGLTVVGLGALLTAWIVPHLLPAGRRVADSSTRGSDAHGSPSPVSGAASLTALADTGLSDQLRRHRRHEAPTSPIPFVSAATARSQPWTDLSADRPDQTFIASLVDAPSDRDATTDHRPVDESTVDVWAAYGRPTGSPDCNDSRPSADIG